MKTYIDLETKQLDVTAPESVQILIKNDGKVIWINIEGICTLRCCQIKHLEIQDERNK